MNPDRVIADFVLKFQGTTSAPGRIMDSVDASEIIEALRLLKRELDGLRTEHRDIIQLGRDFGFADTEMASFSVPQVCAHARYLQKDRVDTIKKYLDLKRAPVPAPAPAPAPDPSATGDTLTLVKNLRVLLYLLLRDHIPFGTLYEIVENDIKSIAAKPDIIFSEENQLATVDNIVRYLKEI